jgi:hypothetical protein
MSAKMESDDEVQEIDPMVIIRCGRKKYRKKILKEELDFHFSVVAKDIITTWKAAKTKMVLFFMSGFIPFQNPSHLLRI